MNPDLQNPVAPRRSGFNPTGFVRLRLFVGINPDLPTLPRIYHANYAIHGLFSMSRYDSAMPSFSCIVRCTPSLLMRETSITLRIAPSGLEGSKARLPLKPTTATTSSASSRMVRSLFQQRQRAPRRAARLFATGFARRRGE